MLCTDVVKYLVEKFAQRFLDMRSREPPEERRQPHAPLEPHKGLAQHISVLGRDSTLQHFVYWSAVIFKRWVAVEA